MKCNCIPAIRIILSLFIVITSAKVQSQKIAKDNNGAITISWDNKERLNGGKGVIEERAGNINVNFEVRKEVAFFSLRVENLRVKADQFSGIFFNAISGLKEGIAFWRYKPWNSWTRPVAINDATRMEPWDVQFFYWQYSDGVYGAALPLSGNGYRTTIGSNGEQWGSKAVSYGGENDQQLIPGIAISFGKNPYELFKRIYQVSLEYMGKGENVRMKKIFPEPFKYIGWCTWNSSEMGKHLTEDHLIEGVKTFTDHQFPLGWILVDDGWFQHKGSQLQSFHPSPEKFPAGFKPMIDRLKHNYGIKYAGIWHAFNGYWNGIDPASELGLHYRKELFSWAQRERVDVETSPLKTYYFIRPESDSLFAFYNQWHNYLRQEGFDFIKVDNQLVTERMAVNNYPLFSLSQSMHKALYNSANKHFKGAVINCMDMSAEAYLNFGSSPVARAVEDYFPYEKGETYDLQRGNAAAHVLQAIYNSIYFSQMVYADFDMFESGNPNAIIHALARTLNNGPIYITDKPGQQNFDLLKRIVFEDGRAIRAGTALLPTEDCLFQLQQPGLFKAFSMVRNTGLLAVFNAADTDKVEGTIKASDVTGIKGNQFLIYDYFNNKPKIVNRENELSLSLSRLGYGLFYVVPMVNGFSSIGLINKYNAPATILNEKWEGAKTVTLRLYEGGLFSAYSVRKPDSILVDNKETPFSFVNNLIEIEFTGKNPVIVIRWN